MDINNNQQTTDSKLDNSFESTKNEDEITNLNINDIYNTKTEEKDLINENNKEKNFNLFSKNESLMNIEVNNKEKANFEYEKLIENNPEELFKTITEETIENWKKILYKKIPKIIKEDCNILNSENSKENYKIVSNDIPRTRFREKVLLNSFSSLLEYFINFYCSENNIIYKQGLNEIISPFLFIKYKIPNIPYHEIYNLFSGYINSFATNYFYDNTIYSLKNSLCLLTLLLKYHAPVLQNLFDRLMITPEMYGTNWLLTAFCGKLKLHIIYYLMNKIIIEDDPLMIHYLLIAFLIHKKNIFFESELISVPVVITTISIDSIEEIDEIFNEALKIREKTPYSFRIFANLLEVFKFHCKDPKGIFEKYKPDTFLTLPIFPSEIFYICYNGKTKCPDENCKNNTKNMHEEDENENNDKQNNNNINLQKCEYCDMKIKKDLNYAILDLRILEFEGQDKKTGILPRVIKIEQKLLKNKYFTDTMLQRFNSDKGKTHFIFLSSKTDFFNEFEENFYIESTQENNSFNIQLKTDKEINRDLVKKISQKEKLKLKEYDNMKKLLLSLLENGFPYISFLYGGFESIHEQISEYNTDIFLLEHDKNCEICKLKEQNNSNFFSTNIKKIIKKSKSFMNKIELIKDKDKDKNDNNKNNNDSFILKSSTQSSKNLRSIQKPKNKKYYTMDGISDLINNFENFVKYCSLIKYRETDFNENDNQGMLIIQKYYLLILKFINNEKVEQIDKLNLNFIQKAEIKRKNNINMDIIDDNEKKFNLYVKFGVEQDAKKFLNEINKAAKLTVLK